MKDGSKSALFAWALLLLVSAASAAEPLTVMGKNGTAGGADVTTNPLRAVLERKQRLVKQLLEQSPAALRIGQSDSVPAKKNLADAQLLYAKAVRESNAGRTEAATRLLDESLRQIASAASLVPDSNHQAAQYRIRNSDLRAAIRTFQSLQKNLSSRMSATKPQTVQAMAGIDQLDSMVEKADALIAGGNQREANVVLNEAHQIVVASLNTMLAAQTIVYDAKFDSPGEEFQYELARNSSYEELIPIALAQLNVIREKAALSARYVQQSRDLREAAKKQASGGDYAAAMKTIQDATSHLQRSLRIAGVLVPESSDFKP